MSTNLKFKNDALEELKKNFETSELDTINSLLDGNTKCNSIKKIHLETFRKIICHLSKELDWIENDTTTEENTKVQEVQNSSESVTEGQKRKETCKFYKNGKCQYGRSGKKPDQQGKICSYSHPPVCKRHEMFGKCMNHRCGKLHLSLCRMYMNSLNCNYGDKCKFFHPKMLTSASQSKSLSFTQGHNQEIPTYAQITKKNVQPEMKSFYQSSAERGPFLGQLEQPQKTLLKQENHIVQDPFLEFMKSQKEILRRLELLEIQNSQVQNTFQKW